MAKTMEEEIDGLDLTKNFTGEVEETPKEQEPAQPAETDPDKKDPPKEEPERKEDVDDGKPKDETKETKPEGDDGKPDKADPFGTKGHTPAGVQKRISELSRSNRELKEQNARFQRELDELKKGMPKPKEKTRDDFATDEEWIDYRAELKARQMVQGEFERVRGEKEMEEAMASFSKSEEDARNSMPDYDDVMSSSVDLPVDRDTYMYVMKSPMGAMVNYTLKKVEAVRNQFLMTPVEGRIAFIKGIEARLTQIRQEAGKKNTETPPAPAPAPAPQAPPALKQPQEVRNQQTQRRLNPATCSMDEWMEDGD